MATAPRLVNILRAGKLNYTKALALQQAVVAQFDKPSDSQFQNVLILTEHDPVYTIGLRSKAYTDAEADRLRQLGAEFHKTNRGGLITFHGPGQLIAYPILHLKQFKPSIRWYVCQIERTIIELCRRYGLQGTTSPNTGVWIDDRKICAIGLHCSRYITTHGLALNCQTDLRWFDQIVPCGIVGKGVTSLSQELNRAVTVSDASVEFLHSFKQVFECDFCELNAVKTAEFLKEC